MNNDVIARRVFRAGILGTALEWYDFILYGTASALVFATYFFPHDNPALAGLASFAVFGVGFLARPLGGLVFGHLGDKVGRKKVLVLTLVIMGVASTLMGLLPSYASVGALAPALLVALRLIQGFAAGAEYAGAGTMAVEFARPERKGVMGSAPGIGAAVGSVLSAVAFTVATATMSNQAFLDWGWRIPFLFSVVLLALGVYVRLRIFETPAFADEAPTARAKVPFVTLLRQSPRNLILGVLASFGPNIAFYIPTVFGASYAVSTAGITSTQLTTILIVVYLLGIGLTIGAGRMADVWSRRGVFVVGAVTAAVCTFPFFWLINTHSLPLIWVAFIIMSVGFYVMAGAQGALLTGLFPTSTRFTGVAVSREFSAALAGGTAPLIAALLLAWTGNTLTVAAYVVVLLVVAGVAAHFTVTRPEEDQTRGAPSSTTDAEASDPVSQAIA